MIVAVAFAVALLEEIRMRCERGDEYETYAARTPFLFPLPSIVSPAVALPMWLCFGKERR